MYADLGEFLRIKMIEAGTYPAEVAHRIGWTRQNMNCKLNHPDGAWFGSILLIAESIGLECQIIDIRTGERAETEEEVIGSACQNKVSTGNFKKILNTMRCELKFEHATAGSKRYRYNPTGKLN